MRSSKKSFKVIHSYNEKIMQSSAIKFITLNTLCWNSEAVASLTAITKGTCNWGGNWPVETEYVLNFFTNEDSNGHPNSWPKRVSSSNPLEKRSKETNNNMVNIERINIRTLTKIKWHCISCKYLEPGWLHTPYLMVFHLTSFSIIKGVHIQLSQTVTYIPKCKHVFLVNSKFCDLYLWDKCTHDQMVAKRSVHRTSEQNKVYQLG